MEFTEKHRPVRRYPYYGHIVTMVAAMTLRGQIHPALVGAQPIEKLGRNEIMENPEFRSKIIHNVPN